MGPDWFTHFKWQFDSAARTSPEFPLARILRAPILGHAAFELWDETSVRYKGAVVRVARYGGGESTAYYSREYGIVALWEHRTPLHILTAHHFRGLQYDLTSFPDSLIRALSDSAEG